MPPRTAKPPPAGVPPPADGRVAHFRAHERRSVRLAVGIRVGSEDGEPRPALVTNVSLAGAGLETEENLRVGERLSVAFATPALWDPLVIAAVVAWSEPPRAPSYPPPTMRAGLTFEYASPDDALAMFELLSSL